MTGTSTVLWDLPTRVCHWGIVVCVALAWWSAEFDRYDIHEWVGYTLMVLVVSRLIWGVIGSRHSRFTDFLAGPGKILSYIRSGTSSTPGHNPLGGWSVVVLLGLLLVQAISGLFNSDDVFFTGPLYYAADTELRDTLGAVHEWAFNVLLGFIGLHLLAVGYHQFRRREPLVQAMVKGRAEGKQGLSAPVSPFIAVVVVAVVAAALWWGLGEAPQPAPVYF